MKKLLLALFVATGINASLKTNETISNIASYAVPATLGFITAKASAAKQIAKEKAEAAANEVQQLKKTEIRVDSNTLETFTKKVTTEADFYDAHRNTMNSYENSLIYLIGYSIISGILYAPVDEAKTFGQFVSAITGETIKCTAKATSMWLVGFFAGFMPYACKKAKAQVAQQNQLQ